MAEQRGAALRKRQQITKASRTMFLWVAGASAIVGLSAVLLFVLVQKLVFNEKVLSEKSNTVKTLEHNNSIVTDLEDNVRLLNTSSALIKLQTPADAEPVQVVFDALPSKANAEALGSALAHKNLLGHPSLDIESLNIDTLDADSVSGDEGTIGFTFTVSADNADALKALLDRLSRSIRSVSIKSVIVEKQNKLQMSVEGEAYYQAAKTIDVVQKEIKP